MRPLSQRKASLHTLTPQPYCIQYIDKYIEREREAWYISTRPVSSSLSLSVCVSHGHLFLSVSFDVISLSSSRAYLANLTRGCERHVSSLAPRLLGALLVSFQHFNSNSFLSFLVEANSDNLRIEEAMQSVFLLLIFSCVEIALERGNATSSLCIELERRHSFRRFPSVVVLVSLEAKRDGALEEG